MDSFMRIFRNKKEKEKEIQVAIQAQPERYVFTEAIDAMNKLSELSGGKNFQYDIYPFEGMDYHKENLFLVTKERDTWFLRICQ